MHLVGGHDEWPDVTAGYLWWRRTAHTSYMEKAALQDASPGADAVLLDSLTHVDTPRTDWWLGYQLDLSYSVMVASPLRSRSVRGQQPSRG